MEERTQEPRRRSGGGSGPMIGMARAMMGRSEQQPESPEPEQEQESPTGSPEVGERDPLSAENRAKVNTTKKKKANLLTFKERYAAVKGLRKQPGQEKKKPWYKKLFGGEKLEDAKELAEAGLGIGSEVYDKISDFGDFAGPVGSALDCIKNVISVVKDLVDIARGKESGKDKAPELIENTIGALKSSLDTAGGVLELIGPAVGPIPIVGAILGGICECMTIGKGVIKVVRNASRVKDLNKERGTLMDKHQTFKNNYKKKGFFGNQKTDKKKFAEDVKKGTVFKGSEDKDAKKVWRLNEYKRTMGNRIRDGILSAAEGVIGIGSTIAGLFPGPGSAVAAALSALKTVSKVGRKAFRWGKQKMRDKAAEKKKQGKEPGGIYKLFNAERSTEGKKTMRTQMAEQLLDSMEGLPSLDILKDAEVDPTLQAYESVHNEFRFANASLKALTACENRDEVIELLVSKMAASSE